MRHRRLHWPGWPGSIPEVVPAINEMVPVGATEVSCALRSVVHVGGGSRGLLALLDVVADATTTCARSRVTGPTGRGVLPCG